MGKLENTLRRLFSRNIIVTRQPGNRLKVVDVSLSQSSGNSNAASYDRYRWGNKNVSSLSGWGDIGKNVLSLESIRRTAYSEYDVMDADAIISSALDIYADESVVKEMNNMIISIKTTDDTIQKILYNLFYDILNIEFNLWYWIRSAVKYGDFFLYLDIREGVGIVNVIPVHPTLMEREDGFNPDFPTVSRFKYTGEDRHSIGNEYLEEFQVAHFRMLTDPNMLPYGKSLLDGARNEFKKLVLLEDAMMLSRIMRAPERRIFKVDVGNIHASEVDGYMKDFISSVKKVPYINETTGQYNLRFNLQNMMEDFYLPVRGSDNGTSIDTLDGLQNENQIQDIEYTKSKVIAALKVPKLWLGYDENTESKSNLAALDIRFARTVERIQKIILSEMYKIAIIHLVSHGYKDENFLNFELTLSSPSIIYKRQQLDLLSEKVNLVNNMLEANLFSRKFIYEHIFDMTSEDWKNMELDIIEDKKTVFRFKQIEDEGNDPRLTGKSFGTPHDIVSMQRISDTQPDRVKNLYTVDGREDNEGQPEKIGSFRTDRDQDFGRDPDGAKSLQASGMASLEHYMRTRGERLGSMRKTLLSETGDVDDVGMLREESVDSIVRMTKTTDV